MRRRATINDLYSPDTIIAGASNVDNLPVKLPAGRLPAILPGAADPASRLRYLQTGKVKVFHLANQSEFTEYNSVISLIAEGKAVLDREEFQWDLEAKNWIVFCRWIEYYIEVPDSETV